VLEDLQRQWALPESAVGYVTSSVQLGFIAGTLSFAFFTLSDRASPRLVFFSCAILGALANAATIVAESYAGLLALRFATGFFLAGIYPVGMRIAAGWYREGLGAALGFLVGALVAGTAFPHLLKGLGYALPWDGVMLAVSCVAALGGLAMLAFVPDAAQTVKPPRFEARALATIFRVRAFRASAFGYFGHMWELYAFWAFVPFIIAAHAPERDIGVSLWTFAVIAAGTLGCAVGGLTSLRLGSARVAFAQLGASGLCCALSPLLFFAPTPLFLAFLLFWGVVVVGDSPQFSALNAQSAPRELVGSALTIANCIGFAITIASIQLLNTAASKLEPQWLFLMLLPGPIFGLLALMPLTGRTAPASAI
jgi:MFS family permease